MSDLTDRVDSGETVMFVHTRKAIKRGLPANRLFVVASREGSELVAWKCVMWREGITHPALVARRRLSPFDRDPIGHKGSGFKLIKVNDDLGKVLKRLNSSRENDPSAFFRPDSLYEEVSISGLRELLEERGEEPRREEEA